MVGAGDRHVAGSDPLAAPILGDGPARTQELAALLPADPCVEDAGARRRLPVERRDAARFRGVELQLLVHADADEWREIEQARNRQSGGHEVSGKIARAPVGGNEAGGEMPACRMARRHESAMMAPPQPPRHLSYLLDD